MELEFLKISGFLLEKFHFEKDFKFDEDKKESKIAAKYIAKEIDEENIDAIHTD